MAKITRRTFLASSTALALPTLVPSRVFGANGAVAPSNQITVGQIGFGWIGGSHLSALLGRKDVRYVGACDVNGETQEHVSFRYANGVIMNHVGGNCLGLTFHGTDGELYVGRDGFRSKPESIAESPLEPGETRLYRSDNHHGNWLDCIRTRRRCVADVETGARSATVCHLGNIAYQLGQTLQWDPATERFTNNDQANRLLSRPLRSPWSL